MTKKKTTRYIFDEPDPTVRERERVALAQALFSGDYSADTYRDRLAKERNGHPVATREEVVASKAFNRSWKRRKHKGYRCTTPECRCIHVFATPAKCYECQRREGIAPVRQTHARGPQRPTMESLRPGRNAALL